MKSDSRVSIRRPGQGMPAPLSQRVVMPDSLSKYTNRTADMTGLIARRARLESHDDGSDVVTSLGTNSSARALLSFQGPLPPCLGGPLRAGANRLKGDHPVYRRNRPRSSGSSSPAPGRTRESSGALS